MYELDEINDFFNTKDLYEITNDRIEELYNLISNSSLRVNTEDEEWVAFSSQDSENKTVENAIKKIMAYGKATWLIKKHEIQTIINEVGQIFVDADIKKKPRIPFYIMVLDKINP